MTRFDIVFEATITKWNSDNDDEKSSTSDDKGKSQTEGENDGSN